MYPDGIPCFGDACQSGVEFCDKLSKFCMRCSAWINACFTSNHISACTEYCRTMELKNRPPSEPGVYYAMSPWLIAVIAVSLLSAVTVIVGTVLWKYSRRVKTVLPCFVNHNENNEQADDQGDEAEGVLIELQTTGDQRPVQVTEEEVTTSDAYPTFGPTALENHAETKLI